MDKSFRYNIGSFYVIGSRIDSVNFGFYCRNCLIDSISVNYNEYGWSEHELFFRISDEKRPIFDYIHGSWIHDNTEYEVNINVDFDKSFLREDEVASFVLGLSDDGTWALWLEYSDKKRLCYFEIYTKCNRGDRNLQQFTYRYLFQFEKWDDSDEEWGKYKGNDELIPIFEFIEESLFDGTFDKLHDDGLLKYHQAGKPKKLAIKWHIKKSEYTAYFWFEDEKICSIFERFYGAHPDTKTDFIIRIDAEQKKYELALFRQGLKEPQIIPEDAYQLLVFKNKFEHYRSDNYNQERGAWIW